MADLRVLKLALLAETKDFVKNLDNAAKESAGFSDKVGGLAKKAALGFAALGAAVGAAAIKLGKDAFREFQKFDSVVSDIGKATGASGDELAKFGELARAVGRQVPQDLSLVGSVVGELNTRLGFTGETLEKNTKLFLDYARINKTDVAQSTTLVAKLVNALELDAADLERTLGKLTKASQITGINVDKLTGFILEAGPAFEEFGFGLDESIALFSGFEAAGARPEELLSSLNILMTRLAKQGVSDFRTGFESLIVSIKEAETSSEAVTIAAEAFGARVGGKVAEDIRAGRFEIDELVKAIGDGENVIKDTANETLTFAERMEILKNNVAIAKGELGEALLPAIENIATAIQRQAIPRLNDLVAGLTGKGTKSVAGATKETTSAFAELGVVIEENDSSAFNLGKSYAGLGGSIINLGNQLLRQTSKGGGFDSFLDILTFINDKIAAVINSLATWLGAINNVIDGLRRLATAAGSRLNVGEISAGDRIVEQLAANQRGQNVAPIVVNVRGAVDPQGTARTVTKAITTATTSTGVRITAPAGFF